MRTTRLTVAATLLATLAGAAAALVNLDRGMTSALAGVDLELDGHDLP